MKPTPSEFVRSCWLADINRYDCKMYLLMGGWRMDSFKDVDKLYNDLERKWEYARRKIKDDDYSVPKRHSGR